MGLETHSKVEIHERYHKEGLTPPSISWTNGTMFIDTNDEKDLDIIINSVNVFVFEILGLQNVNEAANQYKEKLEEMLELLIKMRSDARANKDFKLSDKIRIELDEIGIQLKDSIGGTTFKID